MIPDSIVDIEAMLADLRAVRRMRAVEERVHEAGPQGTSALTVGPPDTLSYHCRLAEGEITLEDGFREIGDLEAAFVQVNAVHLRDRTRPDLEGLS